MMTATGNRIGDMGIVRGRSDAKTGRADRGRSYTPPSRIGTCCQMVDSHRAFHDADGRCPRSSPRRRARASRREALDRFVRDARRAAHARRAPCDTRGTAAPRPAHLGHRPLQLPLRLLHAEGGLRRATTSSSRARSCSRSRRSRASRGSSSTWACEKIRLTGGEPLLRRNLERLVDDARAHPGHRPHADDQRRAARAQGAARCATPGCSASRSASIRSTTRRSAR